MHLQADPADASPPGSFLLTPQPNGTFSIERVDGTFDVASPPPAPRKRRVTFGSVARIIITDLSTSSSSDDAQVRSTLLLPVFLQKDGLA